MKRVAVLGAGGQVGAEVCLLLAEQPGIELVAICRNPASSSFLRSRGIQVRHGIPADPEQAPALLGDADLVANFALAVGLPREARRINARLIEQSFAASPPGVPNVYFSTMSVYGVPFLGRFHRKTPYARQKLHCERVARAAGRRTGKPVYVMRLGHVQGELQGMTSQIRDQVASGPLRLPHAGRRASNTVYTASIVETLHHVLEGRLAPGTYDLVTLPEWSWREVYAYEAGQLGLDLELADEDAAEEGEHGATGMIRGAVGVARRLPLVEDLGRQLLARANDDWNRRLSASHFQGRARSEIAEIARAGAREVVLHEPWRLVRPVPGLRDPAALRCEPGYRVGEAESRFELRRGGSRAGEG